MSADFSPITHAEKASGIKYSLTPIQEAQFGREFTKAKRLLTPQLVFVLKVYSQDAQDSKRLHDITSYVLSQFYLRVSLTKSYSSQKKLSKRQSMSEADHLSGTRFISGSFHKISTQYLSDKCQKLVNDETEGVFIFTFPDLGIKERGTYSLKYELFKYEGYNYLLGRKQKSCPTLSKIIEYHSSQKLKVYGIREYYKSSAKRAMQDQICGMLRDMNNNKFGLMVYRYLKAIQVIKDYKHFNEKGNSSSDHGVSDNTKKPGPSNFISKSERISVPGVTRKRSSSRLESDHNDPRASKRINTSCRSPWSQTNDVAVPESICNMKINLFQAPVLSLEYSLNTHIWDEKHLTQISSVALESPLQLSIMPDTNEPVFEPFSFEGAYVDITRSKITASGIEHYNNIHARSMEELVIKQDSAIIGDKLKEDADWLKEGFDFSKFCQSLGDNILDRLLTHYNSNFDDEYQSELNVESHSNVAFDSVLTAPAELSLVCNPSVNTNEEDLDLQKVLCIM